MSSVKGCRMLPPRPKPPPPEATKAATATAASTRCMAGTPTYGYACGKLAQRVPEGEPMLDVRRREVITLLGGAAAAAAWPFVAKGQPTGKSWRIGQVIGGSAETNGHFARALEQRLGELGYRLGGNLVLVTRYANPQLPAMEDAIRSLIAEIDLLVAWGTIGAVAAKNVAGSLPVVFLTVGAPVEVGLVQSLSRPGGNMTGITFEAATETYGKRLQLLKEILPNLQNVAVLAAEGDANVTFAMQSLDKAAPGLGVYPHEVWVATR